MPASSAIKHVAGTGWSASTGSRSVSTDSSPAVGDILLAFVMCNFGAASPESPTGTWDTVRAAGSSSNSRVTLYKQVVTSAGVNNVALSGSNSSESSMVVYTIDSSFQYIDVHDAATGSGTSQAAASLTTANDDELMICAWCEGTFASGQSDYTGVTGSMTQDIEVKDPDAFLASITAHEVIATATTTGTRTASAANSPSFNWAAVSVALTDVAPPVPPAFVVSQGAAVVGSTSITTAAYGTGWQAGDLIIYTVASGHSSENTPTVSGFTNIGSLSGGGGTFGSGTGPRRLTFFAKTAAGGDDTTPTISLSGGNVMIASSTVIRADTGYTLDAPVTAFGAVTTAGTSWTQAVSSDPGLDVDDLVLLACAVRDDTATSSAEGLTATGSTLGAVTIQANASSTTGNDIGLHVASATVTAGPNSTTPTRTATHATSETGVVGVLRVRPVSSNTDATATPSVVAGTASVGSPTVRISRTVTASVVSGAAAVDTPTVRLGASPSPAVVAGTAAVGSATVLVSTNATATPTVVAGAVSVGSPSITAGISAGVTPSVVAGVASVGSPSVQTGNSATATPAAVAGVAAIGSPTVQASTSATATPSVVAGVAAIGSPSVQAGSNASVSATTVSATATVGSPAAKAGSGVTPATVTGSASVGTPSVTTGGTATPSVVAGNVSVPSPGVSAGGSATAVPQVVAATTSIPTPSLTTSSKAAPSPVAALAAIPAPAVISGSGSTAIALVVSASATIAVPTIRLGAAITPATVNATASVAAPTLHTSVRVPAFTVAAVATIPTAEAVSIVPGMAGSAVGSRPTSRGAYGPEAAAGAGDEFGVASSGADASVPHATGG